MKPKVNDKKCGASESTCMAIKMCPVGAIGYMETDEPIAGRDVNCDTATDNGAQCGCNCGCKDDSDGCGGNAYGRIVIDYYKCTGCGLCAEECCGAAIEMID